MAEPPAEARSLYLFHKELNRPFPGIDEMLACGLERVSQMLKAERLAVLARGSPEEALRVEFCLDRGRRIGIGERLRPAASAALRRILEGAGRHLAFEAPHPLLYAPLRWGGSRSPACGVLRLERLEGAPFSERECEFASFLAEELAQNWEQAVSDWDLRGRLSRLKELADLTGLFASSLRSNDGLRAILHGVARLFDLDCVRLYLIDEEAQALRGELRVDLRGRVVSLRADEIPLASPHRIARAAAGEGGGAGGMDLNLPLVVQGRTIGLLLVDNLLSQQPLPRADADLLRSFVGQIALAVDNIRLFDEVQSLALYDSLTGLPVRRLFYQRLQEEIYRSERSGQKLSVAMMDVDHFKAVNDSFGHQIGDAVLRELGCVILKNLRKLDFPSRYGGDEILVLLPQARSEEAVLVMSRLLQEIRDLRIPVEFARGGALEATASIGIATYPDDGLTADELIGKADEALYWVKSHGRNGLSTRGRLGPSVTSP
jgi:diguanylate cyclase (GGDEF)-like protein